MMKQLEAAGEPVYAICVEDKQCKPVKGKVAGEILLKGDAMAGKVVSKSYPSYPPIARAARADGKILVQVIVDEQGKVVAAQAISGNPLLRVAAEQAARNWLFTPTLLNAKPVKVTGILTFTFNLQ